MNAIGGVHGSGVGAAIDRVDGPLKVAGRALYCAEVQLPGLVHAVMVQSTIAHGTITGFDLAAARAMPGVIEIITHDNAMALSVSKAAKQTVVRPLLQDNVIHYNGQTIAVVVADTLERAQEAAWMVRVTTAMLPAIPIMPDRPEGDVAYAPHDFQDGREEPTHTRGSPEAAFAHAPVRVDAVYETPIEHHNPIEPHATVAVWRDDGLTVWTTTQGIAGAHATFAAMFDLAGDRVRVICPYVGGGFGCKGNTWPPAVLAAMAAKQVGRPVKLVLDRRDMYTCNGYRPRTVQHVRLGAAVDGRLLALTHEGVSQMSDPQLGEFAESVALASKMLYGCENVSIAHKLSHVNAGLPTYMRAPGESSGLFALESAMDELAVQLKMDPIALRLKNYAQADGSTGKPFSSKRLRDCYEQGAARFGWARRTVAPGSMRGGAGRRMLVGYGMATATYPANRMGASAKARLYADGSVVVGSGTQDIGTGTYTVMVQIASDAFGVPAARVTALLGDSRLPPAPVSGGSMTVASVAPALERACAAVRADLFGLAVAATKAGGVKDCTLRDGVVSTPNGSRTVAALLEAAGKPYLEAEAQTDRGDGRQTHALHSFGAQFAEVHVDPDLGEIRVARYVGVFDAGRIVNPKTARSQLIGGITYGIGMALLEQTETDPHTGRIINSNLAEYLVPVNPDVPPIEVAFVETADPYVNALGTRGVGELPMVGVAPAIANAVYHATGKRVRSLPIRLEDVL